MHDEEDPVILSSSSRLQNNTYVCSTSGIAVAFVSISSLFTSHRLKQHSAQKSPEINRSAKCDSGEAVTDNGESDEGFKLCLGHINIPIFDHGSSVCYWDSSRRSWSRRTGLHGMHYQ